MNTIETIVRERQKNPCATLEQIGVKANVTRERVRQILKRASLPTRAFIRYHGCLQCGGQITPSNPSDYRFSYKAKSKTMIPIECSECGRVAWREKSIAFARLRRNKSGAMFCSKQCQGKYTARKYGFSAHPENIGRTKKC